MTSLKNGFYSAKIVVGMKTHFPPKGQQIDEFDICIMCSGPPKTDSTPTHYTTFDK